jgi:hypothetical protein
MNNIISGIGVYLLGVPTGLATGVLTPLAATNAALALARFLHQMVVCAEAGHVRG